MRLGDSRLPLGPGSGGSRVTASIVPTLLDASRQAEGAAARRRRAPAPGSNAPWRERHRRLARLCGERRPAAGRAAQHLRPRRRCCTRPASSAASSASCCGGRRRWRSAPARRVRCRWSRSRSTPGSARVRVLRAFTGIAVGKLAAPALARNQAAGAFVQSLGHALYEGREIDARTGHVLTVNLDDYRMPGIADAPPIEVHFEESGFDHVPGGSVGIGEVASVPTPAAHRQRDPQRGRRAAARKFRSAPTVSPRSCREPPMSPVDVADRGRIPRRRHRPLRAAPQRRLARRGGRRRQAPARRVCRSGRRPADRRADHHRRARRRPRGRARLSRASRRRRRAWRRRRSGAWRRSAGPWPSATAAGISATPTSLV